MNKSHPFENIPGCSLCWGVLPEGETCKACGTANEPRQLTKKQKESRTKLAEQIHKAVGDIPVPLKRF